ncbi:hypothetical protein ACN2C7_05045 [Caulobacter sp. ErkDOM-E]|uniref:hypothetical protein n=1 Tax=Caulobacter sp. ErkDOM-E TaxID=3402778 RepID=UPI003AF5FD7E
MPVAALAAVGFLLFEPELWKKLAFAGGFAFGFFCLLHGAISVHVERTLLLHDRVEVRKLFGIQILNRADVTGIRRGENGLILCSRHGEKQDFEVTWKVLSNPAWVAWLNTLKNFDAEKALAEEAKLEADARFGDTVAQRRETLSRLRRSDRWLSLLTIGVMIWALFWPKPYELAICVLGLMPLVVAAIFRRWRSMFSVVVWPFALALLASIVIALRAMLDIQTFDPWPGYWAAGGAALLAALVSARLAGENRWWKTVLVAAVVGVPIYSWAWGSISFANVLLDRSKSELIRTTVINRSDSDDKHPVVTLRARSLGGEQFEDVDLSKQRFANAAPGAAVCLKVYPGWLGWRWGYIADCPLD